MADRPEPADRLTPRARSDAVVDTKVQGGPGHAVYVYARDDYDAWERELGRPLPAGMFGENLAVSSRGPAWSAWATVPIGAAELEVTRPRIPCRTLQAVTGEPDWVRRFRHVGRPGYCCRVLSEGTVAARDLMERGAAPESSISIDDLTEPLNARQPDTDLLRAALDSPLGARDREYLQDQFDS